MLLRVCFMLCTFFYLSHFIQCHNVFFRCLLPSCFWILCECVLVSRIYFYACCFICTFLSNYATRPVCLFSAAQWQLCTCANHQGLMLQAILPAWFLHYGRTSLGIHPPAPASWLIPVRVDLGVLLVTGHNRIGMMNSAAFCSFCGCHKTIEHISSACLLMTKDLPASLS